MMFSFMPTSFAHEPNFEIESTKDILKLCNFFYEEYQLIGSESFKDHHKLFLNANICPILFEHIAWNSQHEKRDFVLMYEIEQRINENANYIKEKHVGEPSSIPKWFKNKANLWMGWEIKDREFLNAVEEITNSDLSDKSEQISIPKWFKQNAKWYIDEAISEEEFLNSIKYLIKSY